MVSPAQFNRTQDDIISVAEQVAGAAGDMHYPHIASVDNKLAFTTGPNLLTITAGQTFWVGGIRFNSSDLSNMAITIPDGTDGYLRASVTATNGQIDDLTADPIERVISLSLSIEAGAETDAEGTGGGPSSPTSARLFKVIKALGGDTPTVTAYANTGHDHITPDLTHNHDDAYAALTHYHALIMDIITASTTFVAPYAGDYLILAWAGGGSGGGGRTGAATSVTGAGGGAGEFVIKRVTLAQGEEVASTIGLGGAASLLDGNAGGVTSFGSYLTALGGAGGEEGVAAGSLANGGTGGTGGTGDHTYPGQDGMDAEGGNNGNNNGGFGGDSPFGGRGGYPGVAAGTGANGGDGQTPGAGSGGGCCSTSNGNSGTGARGEIRIMYLG